MFPSPIFPSRRRALVGAAALALLSSFAVDTANAYPDRPIKIIVTFPPGGSADIVIRIAACRVGDAVPDYHHREQVWRGRQCSPEAFAKFIRSESEKWGKLIAEAGIKAE
jgi:tripartite-type tricarboxylate transporter receptor subunit TctC